MDLAVRARPGIVWPKERLMFVQGRLDQHQLATVNRSTGRLYDNYPLTAVRSKPADVTIFVSVEAWAQIVSAMEIARASSPSSELDAAIALLRSNGVE